MEANRWAKDHVVTHFAIKILCGSESSIPPTTTDLEFPEFPEYKERIEVEISLNDKIIQTKSKVYIQECKTTDFIETNKQIRKGFYLLDVQKFTQIKTKKLNIHSSVA